MKKLKIVLTSIMAATIFGLFIHGCNTEEINLRAIRDNRTYISSDSTSHNMRWRTNSWVNKQAKYWSSASVIITSVDNTLGGQSSYWLKKVVEKGFKGTILIDENFDFLPISYVSESPGTYKGDLYNYFVGTLGYAGNWYVKNDLGVAIIYEHPELGACRILNPATVNTWANGVYDIFNTYANALRESVNAEAVDFSVGIFRSYDQSSWKPYRDLPSDMITNRADPLSLSKNIGAYTSGELDGFNTHIDSHVSRIKGKDIPLVVYGDRLDNVTTKIEDGSIIGVFFENVTSANYRDKIETAFDYRDTFSPSDTENSLLIIMGITKDVYRETSPTAYANMMKATIDAGSYFTPGANGLYFEYPRYKPGDWWIRSKNDANWQNNRNNPDYPSIAYSPRMSFGLTPITPPADITPPEIPTGVSATANINGSITLNWTANIEGDFSHYNIYRGTTTGNTGLTPYVTNVISSSHTDMNVVDEVEYFYQITSVDTSDNESDKSSEVNATSNNLTPPSTPTGLTASGTIEDFVIILNWNENTESDLASYEVYRDDIFVTSVLVGTETYRDDSVELQGILYTYKIKAKNNKDLESEFSNESSDYVGNRVAPLAPTNFQIFANDIHVTLSYEIDALNLEDDFAGFKLYRGVNTSEVTFLRTLNSFGGAGDYTAWDVNNQYYYKLSTYDTAGNESELVTSTPEYVSPFNISRPSAPGNFSCSGSDLEISLTWLNQIGSVNLLYYNDLDHYELHRSEEGSGFTPSPENLIASLITGYYSDTDTEYDTTYHYKLYAVDIVGNKTLFPSYTSCTTSGSPVDITPPAIPTGLSVIVSEGLAALTWTANTEEDFSYYNVYRAEVISGIEQSYVLLNDESAIFTNSYNDTSINDNVVYRFKVSSVDDSGNESNKSSYVEAVYYDVTPPEVPTGLTASTTLDRRVDLSWSPIENSAGDFSHYIIYRGSSPTSTTQLFTNVTTITFTDNTTTNNTAYYYQISSVDLSGNISTKSTAVFGFSVDTIAPNAPTGVTAIAGESVVTISWNPSSATDIDRYTIYRSSNGTDWELSQVATAYHPTTSTQIAATPNVLRYYSVFTIDNAPTNNTSSRSAVVSATAYDTPTTPVLSIGETTGNGLTVNISWTYTPPSDLSYFNIMRGTTSQNLSFLKTVSEESSSTSDVTTAGTWYYAITAQDDGGRISPLSNVVSVTTYSTLLPQTPSNLTISSQTEGTWELNAPSGTNPTITLSWDANTDGRTSDYVVVRSTSEDIDVTSFTNDGVFVVPFGTNTWSDSYYNETTNTSGFVNGSPYWYKVVARNISGGLPLISEGSNEVTWTPRMVRELSRPFYYANWYQDVPNRTLTSAELDSLSAFDGFVGENFEFYPINEPSRRSIVSDLRTRGSKAIYYTYMQVTGVRQSWGNLSSPTYDNTPFKRIWNYCSSNNNDGFLKDVNGNIIQNAEYQTYHINFAKDGAAETIANILVDAYQGSGVDGEYTGLYLDFLDTSFANWICNFGNCQQIVDSDQDGTPYYLDTVANGGGSNGIAEETLYDNYCVDILKALRREFANRKMSNRLIMFNGSGFYSNDLTKYVDGYFIEYFTKYSGNGSGYSYNNRRWGSTTASNILGRSSSLTSQISPPSVIWEAWSDSNQQYIGEIITLAQQDGWVISNYGFPPNEDTIENGTRAHFDYIDTDGNGSLDAPRSVVPQSHLNGISSVPNRHTTDGKLQNIGDFVNYEFIVGQTGTYPSGTPDTLHVEYENYDMYLICGLISGNNLYSGFPYYIESSNGNVVRWGRNFPTPYPTTPTGFTATASTNSSISKYIDLDWNDVTNFGYKKGFGKYRVYKSTLGSEPVFLVETTNSNYRDTNVIVNQAYSYQVSVTNNRTTPLESTKTSIVNATPIDVTGPQTPQNVTAIQGDGYVALDWDDDLNETVTYTVEFDTKQLVTGLETSSITFDGLTNGVSYDCLIYAIDIYGSVSTQFLGTYTPTAGVEVLSFTAGPTVDTITNDGGFIRYNWSATLGGIANSKSIWYKNLESLPADTSRTIFPWNTRARTPSASVLTTVPMPVPDSDQDITLFWTVTGGNPDTYNIQRKVDNGSWTDLILGVAGNLISYTDATAPRGKVEYRIASVTGGTPSSWVVLSTVNGSSATAVFNESVELKMTVDIATSPSNKLRDPNYPVITIYDAVDPPPVASFTATPRTGSTATVFYFTSTSTNNPTNYYWTFGDGTFAVDVAAPTHTYAANGSYTVSLTASNASGSNTKTENNFITISDRLITALKLKYDFDEGSGTTILDKTENPVNLTISNPSAVSWSSAGLNIVNATNIQSQSFITKLISECKLSNEFTVEMWITPNPATQPVTGLGPSRTLLIGDGAATDNLMFGHGNQLGGASNRMSGRVSGDSSLQSELLLTTNLTHVVYTRSSSGIGIIYINGVQRGSATQSASLSGWGNNQYLRLANNFANDRAWFGTYHMVAVYSVALTQEEVTQNFNSGDAKAINAINELPNLWEE